MRCESLPERVVTHQIDFAALAEAYRKVCAMDAPLAERLAIFERAVQAHGAPFAEAYEGLVARISSGNIGETTPRPGDPMPSFALPDHAGKFVSLESLLVKGPLVLSFNRGHWCEYCGIELKALSDVRSEIAALGATIVSIVPERQEYLAKIRAHTSGALTILSDMDNGYALTAGLAVWLGERVRRLYMDLDLRVDRFQGNDGWFVPVPATFVIAPDGRVLDRFVDADFRRRMDVSRILAALETYKKRFNSPP